jgi:hypothetical protein
MFTLPGCLTLILLGAGEGPIPGTELTLDWTQMG